MVKSFEKGVNQIARVSGGSLKESDTRGGGLRESMGLIAGRYSSLTADVARMRTDVENLMIQFERQYGTESEIIVRAEQVGAAVQRLIWALEREHSGKIANSLEIK